MFYFWVCVLVWYMSITKIIFAATVRYMHQSASTIVMWYLLRKSLLSFQALNVFDLDPFSSSSIISSREDSWHWAILGLNPKPTTVECNAAIAATQQQVEEVSFLLVASTGKPCSSCVVLGFQQSSINIQIVSARCQLKSLLCFTSWSWCTSKSSFCRHFKLTLRHVKTLCRVGSESIPYPGDRVL